MSIKKKHLNRLKTKINTLWNMWEKERSMRQIAEKGAVELTRVQTAYITVLLGKLGATKESPVTITKDEIAKALEADAVKVGVTEDGAFNFYIEADVEGK